MLPPGCVAVWALETPNRARIGLPACSAGYATKTPARNITDIAANNAQPCLVSLIMRPNVWVRPAPSTKIRRSCTRFVKGVGLSKGCPALALKKPPPLVPSCLMASCDATGPCAMVCVAPSTVRATVYGWKFWMTPCEQKTRAATTEIGMST